MPHVESCEPRLLLRNTGLDVGFGSAGVVGLAEGDVIQSILPTPSGIYVDARPEYDPTRRFVRKFKIDGRPDTAWGVNGSVSVLPAAGLSGLGAENQLGYDAATGKLYVAGSPADRPGLAVQRITAGGKLDTAFGTGGAAVEIAPDDGEEFSSDTRSFNAMVPLPGGRLLVSFQSDFTGDFYGSYDTRSDLKFWRLTAAGKSDGTFGDAGQVTIASGGGRSNVGDHYAGSRTSTSRFADWQAYADGSVRVASLLTNEKSSGTYGFGHDTATRSQTQYVQTRIVAPDGTVGAATQVTLARDAYRDAPQKRWLTFRVVLAAVDGRYTRVIGARARQGFGQDFAAGKLTLLTVSPKGRSRPVAIPAADAGTYYTIAGSAGRTAVFSGRRLTVLDAAARPVPFGDRGSVAVNSGLTAAVIDDTDRILAAEGNTVLRFSRR